MLASRSIERTIPEIRALSEEQAAQELPVTVESQIVWVDPLRGSFFLNDGKVGIYVHNRLEENHIPELIPGFMVRVEGTTRAGEFAPSIDAELVEAVGRRPLPEATKFWDGFEFAPGIDCNWYQLEGRLIAYTKYDVAEVILVEMVRAGRSLFLELPLNAENEERLSELMFHWVKFNAVAGTMANSNRQVVGRVFHVSSAADFTVDGISLNEALNNVSRALAIHELMQLEMDHRAIVKTYGTVTHVGQREFFLRGEKAALKVWIQNTPNIEVGDVVEVVGLTVPESITPAFRAHSVMKIRHGSEPVPFQLDPASELQDALNYDLVQVDARLIEIGRSFGLTGSGVSHQQQIKLLCRSGSRLFEADLPEGTALDEAVEVGATLRLVGLFHAIQDTWRPMSLDIGSFTLQLRNADDIQVLNTAPWWTTGRLLWLVGITLVVALIFFMWILLLRKTVAKQTGIIGEKVEREAVLNERQRIARELHDNLEQGLAGAIFQLGGLRRILGNNDNIDSRNLEQLTAVEDMLKHCSVESRSSIMDLRGGLLEIMDLVSAVKVTLASIEDERDVPCELAVDGEPIELPRAKERNVLLVVKEAALNATKHAGADKIQVTLKYGEQLTISVADDGCGFDYAAQMNSGRFGLKGMRERMENIDGSLQVDSVPDVGTTVVAIVGA